MTAKLIKIAVLTDIHAFRKSAESGDPSWLNLAEDQANRTTNPFAGLQYLINSDPNLNADVVLCCGDLGDKASPDGLQYVWSEVNKLQSILKSTLILGTAGNHDMDSRFQNSKFDAKGQVQALSPPFPIAERVKWLEYWARNFTFIDHEEVRFVLLNSAAYHGYQGNNEEPEYLYGRVSDRTLEALLADLKRNGPRVANILLCHHHPLRNDQAGYVDNSQMKNGERLISVLNEAKVGPWLIVHGHEHMPRIAHASGGNIAPAVFSAGSFSAKLHAEFGDKARNEFYILELEVPDRIGAQSSLRGTIASWYWSYGNGWKPSETGRGLGPAAAFGARIDPAAEATKLAAALTSESAGSSVKWSDICMQSPMLRYMVPQDRESFFDHLKDHYGIETLQTPNGEIRELQVPHNG